MTLETATRYRGGMDVDTILEAFAARIPAGQAWPYDPLNTAEQRWVVEAAQAARRELKAERVRATGLAAKAQELQSELDLLKREG